jgi:GNAT superfamily N-acetyltransferase
LIPGYSIVVAADEHLDALPAIELSAATLLRGYAPESVLLETTDRAIFAEAQEQGRLWVALARNQPVGFALVVMLAEDLPHFNELDVAPRHGRQGLGRALVGMVCDWASRAGYGEVTLTTFRAVPWNMPWYARLGFVEIPEESLRPELREVVLDEAVRGMSAATRVAMSYRCTV